MSIREIDIKEIEGIKVGNAENVEAGTGCTVVICEEGATPGVDVRGGAPGTRETDLIRSENLVEKIHAVVLAGGSAFGLDAASGVMRYLEEKGIGFDTGVLKIPIVASAILFDLAVGNPYIRPDFEMGYKACVNAEKGEFTYGNKGAGTGASVGKFLGIKRAMKSGLGCYALQAGELKVGAVVAVNALGDVFDPETGEVIAGLLDEKGEKIISTEEAIIENIGRRESVFRNNTTIGVVITNAMLSKAEANKVASMAHDGYARAIKPVHTMFDGDTIFVMATGKVKVDPTSVGVLAVKAVERAIVRAVKEAESAYGLKSYKDLKKF
ncbi:P1 family peptidase [Caldanaerobacter subterraneus]|uniref:L-aminopeptidase/D-esterase n=1 Tax=Caldanaerobacter subterraneus subsp. pacificus DSM 12653 TaxID=391606 RepID=A0A0F5PLQ2_9THEO|nr:P1 family peptidase [Caldanaerobacter subterraneus]KKC29341.1 L-aminopeptidase/D-esterase [Caldanaerobacter subterraneus subsp. pacificus DSM 12653]